MKPAWLSGSVTNGGLMPKMVPATASITAVRFPGGTVLISPPAGQQVVWLPPDAPSMMFPSAVMAANWGGHGVEEKSQ